VAEEVKPPSAAPNAAKAVTYDASIATSSGKQLAKVAYVRVTPGYPNFNQSIRGGGIKCRRSFPTMIGHHPAIPATLIGRNQIRG